MKDKEQLPKSIFGLVFSITLGSFLNRGRGCIMPYDDPIMHRK